MLSHMFCHTLTHADTHFPQAHKHIYLLIQTNRGIRSFLSAERSDSWKGGAEAEGKSKLSINIASKPVGLRKLLAFRNSDGDMLHPCKLAGHSKIVPLVNNPKALNNEIISGSFEGRKLYFLLNGFPPTWIQCFPLFSWTSKQHLSTANSCSTFRNDFTNTTRFILVQQFCIRSDEIFMILIIAYL